MQQGNEDSVQQHQNASRQMDGVGCGQQIYERTARAGGKIKTAICKLPPSHPLASQKTCAKQDGCPQPGKAFSFSERNTRNRTNWSQGRLPRDLSPRQL